MLHELQRRNILVGKLNLNRKLAETYVDRRIILKLRNMVLVDWIYLALDTVWSFYKYRNKPVIY
jgi:hypothetical protein